MQELKEEEAEEDGESREGANGGRETQFPLGERSNAGGWGGHALGSEGRRRRYETGVSVCACVMQWNADGAS